MFETLFAWLVTYLVHSSLLLGLAWGLDRAGLLARPRMAELVWRVALCGGLVTASLQGPLHQIIEHLGRPAAVTLQAPVPTATAIVAPTGPQAQATAAAAPVTAAALSSGVPARTIWLPGPLADAAPLLVLLWALLAGAILLRTVRGVLHLNATARAMPATDSPELLGVVTRLVAPAGRARPMVRITDQWRSPLVLPNSDICLPQWTMERLNPSQREAMLAHEVAHVLRRDPLWRVALQVIAGLGCFQPLNRLALQRLELAAELDCDAWAARQSGHRRALAEAIYTCAQSLQSKKIPALALAMTRQSSPLLQRIGVLLEESPMILNKPLPSLRTVLLVAAGVLVSIAIALPIVAIGFERDGARLTIKMKADDLQVNIRGQIGFNENEDDVVSLSRAAEIVQTAGGLVRRIEFTPTAQGVTRLYSVNGSPAVLDAEGRAWLAQVIPQVLREAGLDTANRVNRLLAKGGVALVLNDIERIQSDFARSRYLQHLVAATPLDTLSMTRTLGLLADIDSSVERSQATVALLQHQQPDGSHMATLLRDLASMDSDFEKHAVLTAAASKLANAPELVQAYVAATASMSSDFELRGALLALVASSKLDRDGYQAVLSATREMDSSFDICEVMKAVAAVMPADATLLQTYRATARSLGDLERGQAEKALDHLQG